MPYIGREFQRGNYIKLDDISAGFNSVAKTFNLTSGGTPYYPGSAFSIIVSLAGVVLEPGVEYQIKNNTITFTTAPQSSDNFFCIVLGSLITVGVTDTADGTITAEQLVKPLNYDNSLLYLDTGNRRVGINTGAPPERLSVFGNLYVSGITSTSSLNATNLSFGGIGTFGSISVSGISTFNQSVDFNQNIAVDLHSELYNVNVGGMLTTYDFNVSNNFTVNSLIAQFNNDVFIGGSLTVNGTQTAVNVQNLQISDKDIVLGIGTTPGKETDFSANHGGIAVASTEGSPLVSLALVGFNTLPTTYKQIMWVAKDSFGVGTTDAWLFNYGVGIGSTLVPNGVRLAVSNIQLTDDTINSPYASFERLNVSGVGTISNAHITTLDAPTGYINTGITTILSGTNIAYTTGDFPSLRANSGVVTTISGNYASYFLADFPSLWSNSGIITTVSGNLVDYTTGDFNNLRSLVGVVTDISGTNLSYSGVGTISSAKITTLNASTGYVNVGVITDLSGTNISYSGIATIGNINVTTFDAVTAYINTGIITALSGTNLSYSGVGTIGNAKVTTLDASTGYINTGVTTTLSGNLISYTIGDLQTLRSQTGIVTDLSGTNLSYSGIGTIGSVKATTLDVGTAYVNTGIVTTLSGNLVSYTTGDFNDLRSATGIVTALSGTNLSYSGVGTIGNAKITTLDASTGYINTGVTTVLSGNNVAYITGDFNNLRSASGIVTALNGTNLSYSGVSTFSNGPVLIGSGTSTGTASQRLQVTGGTYISGSLGIGTTNPTLKLHVVGDVLVTGITTSTDFNSASDIRLKDNIKPIENPVDKILQLNGVSFNWKENGRSSIGVIAQEVEKVLPELVNGDETKSVNYNGLIGVLIEVVKQQQIEIEKLKNINK